MAAGQPAEPTGFVAAIASLHVDGRVRQQATRALADLEGVVPEAALALRLIDHVPEVREEAHRALTPRLGTDIPTTVFGVLVAGRGRQHANSILMKIREETLERVSLEAFVGALLRGKDRHLRRWAFTNALDDGLFTPDQLLDIVSTDPDQWLRGSAALALEPLADQQHLRALLAANTVEARLVALTRLSDEHLDNDDLLPLLADPAPRVREQARWRARRRGIDVAASYRFMLSSPDASTSTLSASLEGLATTGDAADLEVFATLLRHRSSRVRSSAIKGFSTHAPRDAAVSALEEALLDASPRVCSAAARELIRLQAPATDTATAWASTQPWSRRAAWRVDRGAGSWSRVEADLRASADADPQLASLGVAGIENWLRTSAATTWAPLLDTQQRRIQDLIAIGPLERSTSLAVSFHAGIEVPRGTSPASESRPRSETRPRWRGLLHRRSTFGSQRRQRR